MRVDIRKPNESIEKEFNRLRQGAKFTIKNDSKETVLDINNATIGELANFVATLVKELQKGKLPG